jgi:hypothetical protein
MQRVMSIELGNPENGDGRREHTGLYVRLVQTHSRNGRLLQNYLNETLPYIRSK